MRTFVALNCDHTADLAAGEPPFVAAATEGGSPAAANSRVYRSATHPAALRKGA
jgi:hypothetical protein